MKYIKTSTDIPVERVEKLINTFLDCRIGREVNYYSGVSQGAFLLIIPFLNYYPKNKLKYY